MMEDDGDIPVMPAMDVKLYANNYHGNPHYHNHSQSHYPQSIHHSQNQLVSALNSSISGNIPLLDLSEESSKI